MSWPISTGIMIEPTESETLKELDRFVEAMISIRKEIALIENEMIHRELNMLKLAPHTLDDVCSSTWDRPYTREQAVFPLSQFKTAKIWPSVNRLDDVGGDQNLICTSCK